MEKKFKKINFVNLDKLDKKIITILDRNSRLSDTKIGKIIRKSPQFVRYRINQLLKNQVIIGNNAVIDYSKLGLKKYRIYIKLQNVYPAMVKEIANYFAEQAASNWVTEFSGYWDIGVTLLLPITNEFAAIWQDFRQKYKIFIHNYKMSIVYEYNLFPKQFLDVEKHEKIPMTISQSEEIFRLSAKDKLILYILSKNARIHLIDIARAVNMTSTGVAARIKNLEEKGIIIGYRTNISYRRIGYVLYRVDIILANMDIKAELIAFLVQMKCVFETQRTFNGADFEFEIIVSGEASLRRMMNRTLSRFKGQIKTFQAYRVVKFYKSQFMVDLV